MNWSFFRQAALFIFFLIPGLLFCKENAQIPSIIHWVHRDSSPVSEEEIHSIQSWQKLHPKWHFKLWSTAPCVLQNVEVCPVDRATQNLEKTVLEKEGGILIDLRLIGCKSLEPLRNGSFETQDRSLIACLPNQYDAPRKVLPGSFTLPDQIFATTISEDPLVGVCFSRFKALPGLTKELQKIQTASLDREIKLTKLSKKLSLIKRNGVIIILLAAVNALIAIILWPTLKSFFSKKKFALIFLICSLLFLFLKYSPFSLKPHKKLDPSSFLSLSNVGALPHLPPSDLQILETYNRLFTHHFSEDARLKQSKLATNSPLIPKVIHLIWGGAPFPDASIANIASWMRHHPDWTFMFWTDDPNRPLPIEGMKKRLFDEILSQSIIRPYFEESKNWGEKSDLLRYEILFKEGGVYIDHDIECLHSFIPLHDHVTFYTATEPLHQSQLYDSHLTVSNCLIGAAPGHPIFPHALTLSLTRWNLASQIFPDMDPQSVLLRTLYRTFSTFNEAVSAHNFEDMQSLILPPPLVFVDHFTSKFYESLKATDYPLANHQWANTWFQELPSVNPNRESTALKIIFLSKACHQILGFLKISLIFLTILLLYKGLCSKKSYLSLLFSKCLQRKHTQKT